MSLVSDLAIAAMIMAFIAVFQYLMIMIIGPDTQLYQLAADASRLDGSAHAQFYYEVTVLWAPLIGHFTCLAFPFVRSYRRNRITGVVR